MAGAQCVAKSVGCGGQAHRGSDPASALVKLYDLEWIIKLGYAFTFVAVRWK